MNAFLRFQRFVICSILPAFLGLVLDAPKTAKAAVLLQEGGRVQNIEWRVEGDVVLVTYDLLGKPDIEYDVTVVLLRESMRSFRVVPRSVRGHIGKGILAGAGRQIRWDFKKDVPEGLTGEDYYFEIAAEEVSSSMWLYLSLGAAAAVGGAVFLFTGKSSSTPSGPTTLPDPPARP